MGSIICTSNATAFLDNLRTHIVGNDDKVSIEFRPHHVHGEVLGKEVVLRVENDEVRLPGAQTCRGQAHDSGREPHVRLAIIGANGAGKYMAVNVLVGMQLPTSGSIRKTACVRDSARLHTLSCTCRRHRRCTSCGALRVTTTRRALCSCPMISPSMRSSSVR